MELTRRSVLAAALAASVGLAGCRDEAAATEPGRTGTTSAAGATGTGTATSADGTATATAASRTATATASDGGLDLREANIVDVTVADAGGGEYRFSTTLHHDDAGEDGYANWWQVETRGGDRLGRRTLTHAHSRQPFTRSETVAISDDVDCVVVRGHDETHGYGGRAVLVSVPGGATRAVDQGDPRADLAGEPCP